MQSNFKNNSGITTRNGARKAKIQTRAMASGAKPSAALVAAKKKAQMKKKHVMDTVLRDHYQTAMDSRTGERGPTAFVTDPKMLEHKCLWDENYPECPERLSSVIKRCENLGLLKCCQQIPSRLATRDELNMLHAPSVFDILETTCTSDEKVLEEVSSQYDAVFIHPVTNEVAQLAAGSTIDLVDMIVKRKAQNGIALVRPPGHHAMHAEPCGYCFYNNAALAAKHAITNLNVGRVLIVDWDVHHGQGTQQMFYDDNRVLYFSVHRYEHGSFWPNLKQSNWNYVGCGRGKGYNVNVPLNKTKMQDSDFLAIWHQILMPIALEYQPELVLISAGYDAAVGCPEGEMEVTPACYAHLTHKLMGICPNMCVVLEGGYCLRSLAEGVAMTLRSLLGKSVPNLQPLTAPSDSIKETILNCIYAHKPYWKCFNIQQTYNLDKTIPNISDAAKKKHKVELKWLGDETTPAFYETRNCYPVQPTTIRNEIQAKLNSLELLTKLHSPQHAVCYIYDEAMLKHQNICEPDHVESPERIKKIHERHKEFGLLSRVHIIDSRTANEEEISLVHTQSYINLLKEIQSTKLRDLNLQKETYNSVYFHPESFQCAKIAAGCVLQMVDTVMNGIGGSGVCVVRPPGHHAEEDLPSGFCLINNAAVAAKYAIQNHSLKRILLLDWDIHHGNGTQHIFEEDPRVLYMSLHRYDNGSFFPHSKDADYNRVGKGKGQGYNVNIPWNKRGMGDAEYLAAFTQVILPIAYEYNPELVIVSAGFDACVGDPLGGCKVSPECYGRFTHWLRGLALGRVILCLEGGYNVNSISYAMTMCTKALLGDPIQHFYDPKGHCQQSAIESINNVISVHKKYWTSLKFQEAIPIERILPEPEPSRGLIINESSKLSISMEINNSAASSLNDSTKSGMCHSSFRDSIERKPDDSLEESMKDLTINSYKTCEGNSIASDEIDISFASAANRSSMPDKSKLDGSQKGDSFSVRCKDGNCGSDEDNSKAETSGSKKSKKESSLTEAGSSKEKRVTRSTSRQQQVNETGTLVDYLAENMQAIVNEEMFAVIPMPWCPHLESLYSVPPEQKFSQDSKCVNCDHIGENWVCLHCYVVACARNINGHMQEHCQQSEHHLLLSLTDLSVWCNTCDAYIDNALLYEPKNIAHIAKFGEPMPWCYGDSNNTITMQ